MIGSSNACIILGASDFGHTVDFISDGASYARFTVTDGQSVPQPSSNPTKTGMAFYSWQDPSGNAITFPYTPTDDVTLTAFFGSYRDDMCLTEANKLICVLGGRAYRKTNDGWAIAGYRGASSTNFSYPVLVALSVEASAVTAVPYGTTGYGGSFVYHDITYHYCSNDYGMDGDLTSTATDVDELYKCTDATVAEAALTLVKRYLGEI